MFAFLVVAPAAHADKRVALVIGNSAYRHTPALDNPRHDAGDMAALLKKHGFEVIEGLDLDKAAFDRKVGEFAVALKGVDAGVFFYAGHGLQVAGRNYLVPVDAKAEEAALLNLEMVRVDTVHSIMEEQTKTNILFLDACRDNPLARNLARSMGTRSAEVGRGLAEVRAGVGTLISFSTQPGNVALDGAGRNSPYSGALVERLGTSREDLSAILIDVRNDVMRETRDRQVPWEHVALRARFYLSTRKGSDPAGLTPGHAGPTPPQTSEAAERAWALVKDNADVRMLEAFRKQYGAASPFYDRLAEARIEQLKQAAEAKTKADAEAQQANERERLALWQKQEKERKRAKAESMPAGRVFRDCPDVCPEMVVLPAGEFIMGSNDNDNEKPPHKVTIQRPFAVGKFEVTIAEWKACLANGGCNAYRPPLYSWQSGKHPVDHLSWHDAQAYVAWLSRKTSKKYRLLSEAEWEYAARAGTMTRYAFGGALSASQARCSHGSMVEVGTFPPNAFGLHDMHGNVEEWVEDSWHYNYEGAPLDGSVWGGDTEVRVLRGGDWASPVKCRSAYRGWYVPSLQTIGNGFRVARAL